jgi:hypothetical protein
VGSERTPKFRPPLHGDVNQFEINPFIDFPIERGAKSASALNAERMFIVAKQ